MKYIRYLSYIESARNLLFGKAKSDRLSCRQYQYRSQTQLEMARRAPMIDMDKEYQKFLLIKHPEIECSQERFKALSSDPQRKMIDESSIKEAIIILEAEGRGIVEEAIKILIVLHDVWVTKFTSKRNNLNSIF